MPSSSSGLTWNDVSEDFLKELVRNPFRVPILVVILIPYFTGAIERQTAGLLLTALLGAVLGKYYDIFTDAMYVGFERLRARTTRKLHDYADLAVTIVLLLFLTVGIIIGYFRGPESFFYASVASFVFFTLRGIMIHGFDSGTSETPKPF